MKQVCIAAGSYNDSKEWTTSGVIYQWQGEQAGVMDLLAITDTRDAQHTAAFTLCACFGFFFKLNPDSTLVDGATVVGRGANHSLMPRRLLRSSMPAVAALKWSALFGVPLTIIKLKKSMYISKIRCSISGQR